VAYFLGHPVGSRFLALVGYAKFTPANISTSCLNECTNECFLLGTLCALLHAARPFTLR